MKFLGGGGGSPETSIAIKHAVVIMYMPAEIFVGEGNLEKGKVFQMMIRPKKAIIILFTKDGNLSKFYVKQNLIQIYTKKHQIAQFFRWEHAPKNMQSLKL